MYVHSGSVGAIKDALNILNICELIVVAMCPDLRPPTNGAIDFSPSITSKLEGAIATYSCADGYLLFGDVTRTCEDSGTGGKWNGMETACLGILYMEEGRGEGYQ